MHEQLMNAFKEVYDPELGVSIVDLGLIRRLHIADDGTVEIDMTLTSPACPIGPELRQEVIETAQKVEGVESVTFQFVFSPPWNANSDPTDDGKFQLSMML